MKRYSYEGNDVKHPSQFFVLDNLRGSAHPYEGRKYRPVAECEDRDDAEMIVEILNATAQQDN